jgi:hypothetical protein
MLKGSREHHAWDWQELPNKGMPLYASRAESWEHAEAGRELVPWIRQSGAMRRESNATLLCGREDIQCGTIE